MEITDSDIRSIAHLARLDLTDEEVAVQRRHISALLRYFAKLQTLDVSSVAPTAHALDFRNVLREDVVEESLDPRTLLQNAPRVQDDCFIVPRILED